MRRLRRTVGFILTRGIEQVTFSEIGQMKRASAGSLDREHPKNVSKSERAVKLRESTTSAWFSSSVSSWRCTGSYFQSSSCEGRSEDKTIYIIFDKSSQSHLIHWGMGLFCLPFLARIRFTRKVFRADIPTSSPLQYTRLVIGAMIASDQHM